MHVSASVGAHRDMDTRFSLLRCVTMKTCFITYSVTSHWNRHVFLVPVAPCVTIRGGVTPLHHWVLSFHLLWASDAPSPPGAFLPTFCKQLEMRGKWPSSRFGHRSRQVRVVSLEIPGFYQSKTFPEASLPIELPWLCPARETTGLLFRLSNSAGGCQVHVFLLVTRPRGWLMFIVLLRC